MVVSGSRHSTAQHSTAQHSTKRTLCLKGFDIFPHSGRARPKDRHIINHPIQRTAHRQLHAVPTPPVPQSLPDDSSPLVQAPHAPQQLFEVGIVIDGPSDIGIVGDEFVARDLALYLST